MKVSRRTALKGGAGVGAGLFLSRYVPGWLSPGAESAGNMTPVAQEGVEEWVPTTCWIGKQDCSMLARKIDGRVVKFEGHPGNPRNNGTLCPKGISQIQSLYDPNRVKTPLLRTNEKGVPGEFQQISWDEALTLVAEKMNEVMAKDPKLLLWQKGRSKAKKFYDDAFVKATGATKMGHGAYCSDAGYRALEYTVGMHGVMHPDFRHTNYLLCWGWNVTNAGGNKTCWLTWPQQLIPAKERGLKMVSIDPRLRSAAHFADEWVPIKPSTDLALALALCHELIERDTIDRDYLRTYSNSPFLVKADGFFLKETRTVTVENEDGEEEEVEEDVALVWDEASGGALPFDTQGIEPALEGEFTVDGARLKTAFQAFKDHVAEYTPEWAADICGIPVAQIRQIARDLGDNAMIGSTIELDGITLPYRPVAIMTYHLTQQELGFQMCRAQTMLNMLLGNVGAVGGTMTDWTWKVDKNWEGLDNIEITDSPNFYLKNSKFYPINSALPGITAKVMLDPEKYGVADLPEMAIVHHANPLGSFLSRAVLMEAWKKFNFIVVIDPWLSITADRLADVVLPAATIEKYEGPIDATDQYTDAETLRIPPMDPMFDSRGDIDIYLDLCEKAGILDDYITEANKALKLEEPYAIPTGARPDVRDIFDRWAKAQGVEEGVSFFETEGVLNQGPVAVTKKYPMAIDPPFDGAVPHRLYGESLLRYQQEMKAMGAEEIYWQDYTPLPTWREPTMEQSPSDYDLYLTSFHMIEFKQSRTPIPIEVELAPKAFLEINPKTAKDKGIGDGDEVLITSHNAVNGDTRTETITARYRESIRPDTVAMPHHYGNIARHPSTSDQGPSPNELFYTGEGYVSNTADQSFHVKVKVEKA
ncbi:MAG TPA: molybdopterin-dependent oxidoreductase [Dehalococcoidia bacterium]